jgi:hypothetical protein
MVASFGSASHINEGCRAIAAQPRRRTFQQQVDHSDEN